MNNIDIDQMTYKEMHELRVALSERMKDMRDSGIAQLRATIAEQATLLGVELRDLLPKRARKRRKKDEDGDADLA